MYGLLFEDSSTRLMLVLFFFFKETKFICIFGCARSYLWHAGSLVVACTLLVVTCGIWFADQ